MKTIKRGLRTAASSGMKLLYTRAQTAELLGGVSVMTIIRLEKAGVLKPIHLNPFAKNPKVFYPASEVHALIQGRHADATISTDSE